MLSCFSHVQLFVTLGTAAGQAPWDSPDKNTGMGFYALLQGIFLTQGWACVSCISYIAGRFFIRWATWEVPV